MINSVLISLYYPELSRRILQITGAVFNNFGTSILVVWIWLLFSFNTVRKWRNSGVTQWSIARSIKKSCQLKVCDLKKKNYWQSQWLFKVLFQADFMWIRLILKNVVSEPWIILKAHQVTIRSPQDCVVSGETQKFWWMWPLGKKQPNWQWKHGIIVEAGRVLLG